MREFDIACLDLVFKIYPDVNVSSSHRDPGSTRRHQEADRGFLLAFSQVG